MRFFFGAAGSAGGQVSFPGVESAAAAPRSASEIRSTVTTARSVQALRRASSRRNPGQDGEREPAADAYWSSLLQDRPGGYRESGFQ
jgi:hypothetical protein